MDNHATLEVYIHVFKMKKNDTGGKAQVFRLTVPWCFFAMEGGTKNWTYDLMHASQEDCKWQIYVHLCKKTYAMVSLNNFESNKILICI